MEWIDVKDRLPETSENVIACDIDGRVIVAWYYDNEWRGGYLCNEVTHWQPLPKPPKTKVINNDTK